MYGRSGGSGSSNGIDNFQRQIRDLFVKGGIPTTMTLITISIVSFFFTTFVPSGGPFRFLAFESTTWPARFWTPFTWPLVGYGLGALFAALWAWWIAGSLERSWGTRTFTIFFVAVSALTAFTLWGGALLLGRPAAIAGLWQALAAPTVAWCVLNRREVIRVYGIIPVSAPILGAITVIALWYENGAPWLGLFALSGCAAAYWYATNGRSSYRGYTSTRSSSRPTVIDAGSRFRDFDRESPGRRRPFSPSRWWRDRQERKRLENIFKRSGFGDDPDDPKRR